MGPENGLFFFDGEGQWIAFQSGGKVGLADPFLGFAEREDGY